MRFVHKEKDLNRGFTDDEIAILSKRLYIHRENAFYEFLNKAGKKSNAFETDFKDLNDFIAFQEGFNSYLKKDAEFSALCNTSYCFLTRSSSNGDLLYYFIKTENPGDPEILYYSPNSFLWGDAERDGRDNKSHLNVLKSSFTEHLEWHTSEKFGSGTVGEKISEAIFGVFRLLRGKRD